MKRRTAGQSLTVKQKRELAAVAAMPDDRIDTTDIPELPPCRPGQGVPGEPDFGLLGWSRA
jgi:hypothetical protein